MTNYIITNSPLPLYNKVIFLLDYTINITNYIKDINSKNSFNSKVIVDTLLVSGNNQYRFISFNIDETGKLDIDNYEYVNLKDNEISNLNNLIKDENYWVRNSILTLEQKNKLLSLK